MWPRDAYVGQRVVFIGAQEAYRFENPNPPVPGKVYTIREVLLRSNGTKSAVYIDIRDGDEWVYRADAFKPVDESRLDVFREMLKNVPNRKNVVRPETV